MCVAVRVFVTVCVRGRVRVAVSPIHRKPRMLAMSETTSHSVEAPQDHVLLHMLLNIEAIKGESFHMHTDCPCHGRVVEPGTAVVPQVVNAP